MPDSAQSRHGLTVRENWGRYAAGMLTEAAFILGLTGLALLMALIAIAVCR